MLSQRRPKSPLALTLHLHERVRILARESQHQDRLLAAPLALSPTQWHALQEVASSQPLSMNELAERLRIARSTATRVVDLLEEKGWVRRGPAPSDRRQQWLSLTPTGEGTLDHLEADGQGLQRAILAQLGEEEAEALLRGLELYVAASRRVLDEG